MANQRIDINTNYSEVTGIPGTCVVRSFEASTGTKQDTAALTASTMYVLVSNNDVHLHFAASPTATANTMLWPAFVPLFFKTPYETTGTLKISALSHDANAGSLFITPMVGAAG